MKTKSLIAVLVLLMSLTARASDRQGAPVRVSDLDQRPLVAGPLRLTIKSLRNNIFGLGTAHITIKVENTSAQFATFDPEKLSLVDRDRQQIDILRRIVKNERDLPPRGRHVAPGAILEDKYEFDRKFDLPARLYYDGQLIAEIVE